MAREPSPPKTLTHNSSRTLQSKNPEERLNEIIDLLIEFYKQTDQPFIELSELNQLLNWKFKFSEGEIEKILKFLHQKKLILYRKFPIGGVYLLLSLTKYWNNNHQNEP